MDGSHCWRSKNSWNLKMLLWLIWL